MENPPRRGLRAELANLGWSCEQLIARINERRARRGQRPLHRKSAYPWVRGGQPAPGTVHDVVSVLSHYAGAQVSADDFGWSDQRSRRRPRALDNPYESSATDLLRETQGEASMQRRAFLLLSGAAATGPALDLLLPGASRLHAAQHGDTVSTQLAETVEGAVRQARGLDDSEGSTSALLWAEGIWQNLAKLIVTSRYSEPIGIRLHTAAIEMSETYGWMLFDVGDHPKAQRVFQTGLRLAREAHDAPSVHQATTNLLGFRRIPAFLARPVSRSHCSARRRRHLASPDLDAAPAVRA